MRAQQVEFGQLRMGAALLVAALMDGWTALQTRDFASLAGAASVFWLAIGLCLAQFERPRLGERAAAQCAAG